MTRDAIQAALNRDPAAVFAVRPDSSGHGPVHVRGLRAHPSFVGRWHFAEYRQTQHPDPALREWQPARPGAIITSRELVDVAAAEHAHAERKAVAQSRLAKLQTTARAVTRLGLLGVDAAQIGQYLVVRDVAALDDLLDRLENAKL